MGNRAVITFDEKPTDNSVGVYLHWNGGPESVLAFVEAMDKLKVRDNSDKPYELARFVQIIGNYFGGTLSVGVGRLSELDCEGDNGLYSVTREKGVISIRQKGRSGHWYKLNLEKIREHPYWTKGNADNETILEQILLKNKMFLSTHTD